MKTDRRPRFCTKCSMQRLKDRELCIWIDEAN